MVLTALNLQNKRILIVGGGAVATRKLSKFLNQGADVLVISLAVSDEITNLQSEGQVNWKQEAYQSELLVDFQPQIVIAATDDAVLNETVTTDAHKIGAWVNNASDSETSDFHMLADIDKAPIRVGLSTGSTAPSLIKELKDRIIEAIGEDIPTLATWLADIRPMVKDNIANQKERGQFFHKIVASNILDLLEAGEIEAAREHFDKFLEELA
mgnify:CR=1 FL=1